VGPREGRFGEDAHKFDAHSLPLVVLGTFILWFGWYGFNCGSTLGFSNEATATQAALVAMNTTLSAAAGGLTVFVLRLRKDFKCDLGGACNGVLAGLVAVCAGVDNFEPWMAIIVGVAGAVAQEVGHIVTIRLKVDDPLDAFAVHGCAGAAGVLLRPLADKAGADGSMFGAHCLAILFIAAWSGGISAVFFGAMRFQGWLTVSASEQKDGADATELSQKAYGPMTSLKSSAADSASPDSAQPATAADKENKGEDDAEPIAV